MTTPVDQNTNTTAPSVVAEQMPKRSGDSLLDLILIITLLLIGLLFLEEVRPDLVSRWLQFPTSTDVEALTDAIIQQESNGNYGAVNPDSGALGYAQIMPENLPLWSREALGYEVTAEQFLANPDLQHEIIEHRLMLYWQQALLDARGDKEQAILMVASRWYSGDPYLYQSTRQQFYDGREYPSIAQYSQSVLQQWQKRRRPWL
ncbi:MAG: transglycosylase SLT domain-containing protein [Prochlorotrichaceae cyanobacterium]